MRIGTAGWSIPAEAKPHFAGDGAHLERYASVLNCAEINSSFHRSHREAVYRRWAEQTPAEFRFAVKLPRAITHEGRLRRAREPLRQFLSEVAGLGPKLGPLLVQLPPSFAFEARPVRGFFQLLAELHGGPVVCEPRHASWFSASADAVLARLKVARAVADPAPWPQAAHPGGGLGPEGDGRGALLYWRWHGSPRKYWSRYDAAWIQDRAAEIRPWPAEAECWCIFDNTAGSGAVPNALQLRALIADSG